MISNLLKVVALPKLQTHQSQETGRSDNQEQVFFSPPIRMEENLTSIELEIRENKKNNQAAHSDQLMSMYICIHEQVIHFTGFVFVGFSEKIQYRKGFLKHRRSWNSTFDFFM